ncbi:MAG TPA: GNAT family N-acetyltransferase [Spirochaetia bacterium]|nr:GNAT family N-acetyltransferase [Spirochaetia bacterium]
MRKESGARAGAEPRAEIGDLAEAEVGSFCKCLEDWSAEFDDEGGRKLAWYGRMREKGFRVKVAREEGKAVGMIQYGPAELAPIEGKGLYYVYCVWVHGYKEGVGNRQRRGLGKALLRAAEEDARALGAKGLAAWGLRLPFFMRSSWFKRQGYEVADRDGMAELVLKRFEPGAEAPRFVRPGAKPEEGRGRVRVAAFVNGWCPAQNLVYERARRAAEAFPDKAEFVGVETEDKARLLECGFSDALFIDGKAVRTGPPLSYEKLRKLVEGRLRKRGLLGRGA